MSLAEDAKAYIVPPIGCGILTRGVAIYSLSFVYYGCAIIVLHDEITYHLLSKHLNVTVEFSPSSVIDVAPKFPNTDLELASTLIIVTSCPSTASGNVK
tara:strand:+ start:1168 stop:1464 length:297 start_codon:yes stop_codon:yes gene_type:complete